jgi:uncharacterized membrane protein
MGYRAPQDYCVTTRGVTLSWLADVASSFGIPVVAASIAGSIYWALSKAEKAARPEALADISAVLKDPSWSRSVKPWSIVERLFVWTFGERHFSVKCMVRSAISTVVMVTSLIVLHIIITGDSGFAVTQIQSDPLLLSSFVYIGFVPDYVALLKTRTFLRIEHKYPAIVILCFDAVGSIVISIAIVFAPIMFLPVAYSHLEMLKTMLFVAISPVNILADYKRKLGL